MSKQKKKPKFEYTKGERALIAILTAVAVTFVFVLFGAIDVFANNITEFNFTLGDIFGYIITAFAASTLIGAAVLFLFKGYLLNVLSAAALSVLVGGFIDNTFVNRFEMTSGDVAEATSKNLITFLAVYALSFAVMLALSIFLKKKWKSAVIFLCILFVGINASVLVSDFASKDVFTDKYANVEYVSSNKGLLTASKKENIVYIIFDRFDTKYFDEVVKKYPDYFDSMTGFTYFDGATSTYSRTYPAVTTLLTGNTYNPGETPDEYFERAYSTSAFLKDVKASGYKTNIFVDKHYEYNDAACFKDLADNVEKVSGRKINKLYAWLYVSRYSVIRNFSYLLSKDKSIYYARDAVANFAQYVCEDGEYHDNDKELYKRISSEGLTLIDDEKLFTFLYLHGAHTPHHLDENCEEAADADVVSQTVGAFKIVLEYIDELKQSGAYDNTTIVITADHGYAYTDVEEYSNDNLDSGTTACIFFKPRSADANAPLAVSSVEATTENIIPTIVKDAGLKSSADYGTSLFDLTPEDRRTRHLYQLVYDPDSYFMSLNHYEINGDAKNLENWTFKEKISTDNKWY